MCMRIYYSDIYLVTFFIVAARSVYRFDVVVVGVIFEGFFEFLDNVFLILRVV